MGKDNKHHEEDTPRDSAVIGGAVQYIATIWFIAPFVRVTGVCN